MWYRIISLLFVLTCAPACAPSPPTEPEREPPAPLVLLTDIATWSPEALAHYRDSLETANYRVVVSGFAGETPTELVARLPWLLQPGVTRFIYDESLAGKAGGDSLRGAIQRLGHDIPVSILRR